jgi:hypothetical protein
MSQEPDIVPKSLRDLSAASCEFRTCALPSAKYAQCLVVAFAGAAGNSHEHVGTFRYMRAMIAAGIAAWDPVAVVLDLTNLWYEWGDEMGEVLGTIPLPVAVVTSQRNRKGLTSLVEAELFQRPRDWLFDTLADALGACDRQYGSALDQPPAARPAT